MKEVRFIPGLLVDGDPTEDAAVFADWENNINLVMKDGIIYKNTL